MRHAVRHFLFETAIGIADIGAEEFKNAIPSLLVARGTRVGARAEKTGASYSRVPLQLLILGLLSVSIGRGSLEGVQMPLPHRAAFRTLVLLHGEP